jgi:putative PIN family toxin of toxin-antitoxin system
VRAVLDPNVIISALLSRHGPPARALRAWLQGEFELVVSPLLLDELKHALAYPKLRKHIEPDEAGHVIEWLASSATMVADPKEPPSVRSPDPGDDYLVALAEVERAALVSGDDHLLGLEGKVPVFAPSRFLRLLEAGNR